MVSTAVLESPGEALPAFEGYIQLRSISSSKYRQSIIMLTLLPNSSKSLLYFCLLKLTPPAERSWKAAEAILTMRSVKCLAG